MLAKFLASAVISAVSALGADSTRLQIAVTTLGGKPIDRAAVVVKFVEGRSIAKLGKQVLKQWEVRTNQEGVAKIPSIPEGKVRVQVIAKGYQTFGEVFEVEGEDKTLTIKLNPPQPAYSAHQ
ncbi:MAG TPA: carboxypeptidase-like regulatory domain-containing protein [Bryobacteraceae bacterium]|nr:carboxypeptidase-like regulatory domain-containing protein [Bryobacteraceae bacterium]